MTLLGLDFDNTLVRYDKLFHQLAVEKGLIEKSVPADKTAIRDYLRSQGRDEQFTLLQGEVYGLRILEAEPAEGMLEALDEIHQREIPMVIVSHKTRTPYKGPAFDLHRAAWSWLEKYKFFSADGLSLKKKNVYFEESKGAKISKIIELECTHYIDDLPEILNMLPNSIKKYLYDPKKRCNNAYHESYKLTHWQTIKDLDLKTK
ncbi:hypothetical protein KR100_01380 [Synechococcus sp. KORDI-100]|uniref:hypothetical protein n=1 Tax=Synechococcus sp. KORDI-100 TaxID=1280380 RepID=UPI0004E076FA|nr:hypothetical protein [Synechococcus sp. KORDI-100]AII42058.1 hypothetical protein KR100_01380 [Synechococcus sp. KORDI-100]